MWINDDGFSWLWAISSHHARSFEIGPMNELIHSNFKIFQVSAVLYFFVFIAIIFIEQWKEKLFRYLLKVVSRTLFWEFVGGGLPQWLHREVIRSNSEYSKVKRGFTAKELSEEGPCSSRVLTTESVSRHCKVSPCSKTAPGWKTLF